MTPPQRVLLLVYDTFAEFEVSVLLTALRGTDHTLTTVGLDGSPVTTTGLLRVLPDVPVTEVDPAEFDALVIPGGDASHAIGHESVRQLVRAFADSGKLLAAICGGPAVLGDAGVLHARKFTASLTPKDGAWDAVEGQGAMVPELLVVDGAVVTATGSSYLAFAEEVVRQLDGGVVPDLEYFRKPSFD